MAIRWLGGWRRLKYLCQTRLRRPPPIHAVNFLMRRDRIVPLIVAVVLFMENMDSTAIATSPPIFVFARLSPNADAPRAP